MTLILGIDIGAAGAIALLNADGSLVGVEDMPVLTDGPAGRRSVNAPLLAGIIFKSHADHAFVEFVGARSGEGAVGAFAFGRSRGVVEGVLGAAGVSVSFIAPASWKRAVAYLWPPKTPHAPKQSAAGPPMPRNSLGSKTMAGLKRRSSPSLA
jgi:crossover junction endodeoxyribonuclease RuvC